MFESLMGSFLSSEHGQGATQALADQGVAPDLAQSLLGQAMPAVGNMLHPGSSEGGGGLLGGLIGGHGITGALEDGALSAASGRIAEIVAEHLNVNPDVASRIAAAIGPFLISFVKEKIAHRQG